MSSSAGPSLPHRAISTIRGGGGHSAASPSSPHTPSSRTLSSGAYGSPSSLRADEDLIVIELGSRKLRIGFAGDSAPKRTVSFAPEQERRVGDFRAWEPAFESNWRQRSSGASWAAGHELWQLDVRGQDMALIRDKLERELKDAFTKYLLIDSKPRKISLVLPLALPLPLLSSVLDTIFNRFQTPTVSILSSPVMAALAAGARSALVIDLGWHETTVTAVYEYRQVDSWRTTRAGKHLLGETYSFLLGAMEGRPVTDEAADADAAAARDAISFAECEEVMCRMLWCRHASQKSKKTTANVPAEGLPTVHEQDESEDSEDSDGSDDSFESADEFAGESSVEIKLNSCSPPRTLQCPFSELAEPCERTFFESRLSPSCFDDHELPVHLLIYRALLRLPMDVRALCMSRLIFTGGCSNIIGIKGRIMDELSSLAHEQKWDPIQGKGVQRYKDNPKLWRNRGNRLPDGDLMPVIREPTLGGAVAGGEEPSTPVDPAHAVPMPDQVEELIKKEKSHKPTTKGSLRVVDSLGPWCGASMAAQLKVAALAIVDKEVWQQQGVHGASRPSDIDAKTHSRQSLGAGGLIRGQGSQPSNWTLGVWGLV